MENGQLDKERAVQLLNRILELELAGVVRYTHYSLMVYGYSRIPIVTWLRGEATESLAHAHEAGEMVTTLGEHPSLAIGPLLETHNHDIGAILKESYEHEKEALEIYGELMKVAVEGGSVLIEEYARKMITLETAHLGEVDKMLREPGDVAATAHHS